jgi:hypothetical protein
LAITAPQFRRRPQLAAIKDECDGQSRVLVEQGYVIGRVVCDE